MISSSVIQDTFHLHHPARGLKPKYPPLPQLLSIDFPLTSPRKGIETIVIPGRAGNSDNVFPLTSPRKGIETLLQIPSQGHFHQLSTYITPQGD